MIRVNDEETKAMLRSLLALLIRVRKTHIHIEDTDESLDASEYSRAQLQASISCLRYMIGDESLTEHELLHDMNLSFITHEQRHPETMQ